MTAEIDFINPKFLKKAKYQMSISTEITQCLTCNRKCQIGRGKSGFCRTRININGDIFSVVYGLIPALSFNPIEKKPLYHFHPGTIAITVGTYGCNFSCWWCQNYHISKENPLDSDQLESNKFISPERLIEIALMKECQGTSISFNEPTLLFNTH